MLETTDHPIGSRGHTLWQIRTAPLIDDEDKLVDFVADLDNWDIEDRPADPEVGFPHPYCEYEWSGPTTIVSPIEHLHEHVGRRLVSFEYDDGHIEPDIWLEPVGEVRPGLWLFDLMMDY